MAKTSMITRTIQTTEVDLLCLNIVEGEPFNTTVAIPRTYKDEAAMLKAAAKLVDNDYQKAVHVVGSRVKETLYGMKETDFIAHAEILPPRPVKETGEEPGMENE